MQYLVKKSWDDSFHFRLEPKTERGQNLQNWVFNTAEEEIGRWLIKLTEESKNFNVEVEALNINKSAVSQRKEKNQKVDSLLE